MKQQTPEKKKLPIRMCAGCRENKLKKELIRIVRSPEGDIAVDLTGKKSGRGVYICKSESCLKRAQKTRALQRALNAPIEEAVIEVLSREILEAGDEDD